MDYPERHKYSRLLTPRCWRIAAFTFLVTFNLFISGPLFGSNPFDGMSAIDIEVAATLTRGPDPAPVDIGLCMDNVDEVTGINFLRFEFVELRGRPGHEGLFPIVAEPLPGEAMVMAELIGNWQTANFRLLDESGTLISDILLEAQPGSESATYLIGTIEVPGEPFRVAVSGTDKSTTAYDLTCSYLFRPMMVEVTFEEKRVESQPGIVQLQATVTNHGPADTFALTPTNDDLLPISSPTSELILAQDESAPVAVEIDMPSISSGVLITRVRLTATGVGNPSNENFGESKVYLERFNFIGSDGFESNGGGAPE